LHSDAAMSSDEVAAWIVVATANDCD